MVFYGNRIDATPTDALVSTITLKNRIRNRLTPQEAQFFEFKTSYNQTAGILADLLESVIQRPGNDYSRFWRILAGLERAPSFYQKHF